MRRFFAFVLVLAFLPSLALAADYPICGGDMSNGTAPFCKITGVQGLAVPVPASGTAQALECTSTTCSWVTVSGGGSFTAGGDLGGSSSSQQVLSITGSAGLVSIAATGNILTWANTTTAPGLTETTGTGASATGATMSILSQSESGTTSVGGTLILGTGTGTSTPGILELKTGATQIGQWQHASGDFLSFGANPASTGYLRLTESQGIRWLNNAATQNILGILVDGSDEVQVGDVTNSPALILGVSAGNTIFFDAGGTFTFKMTGDLLNLSDTANNYTISQAALATASGTGHSLTIQAQNESGTSSTGGDLKLSSGTGTNSNGSGLVHIQTGTTDRITVSSTGFLQFEAYGTGLLHSDSGGNITSSSVAYATDISGAPAWHTQTFCSSGCTHTSGSTYTPVTNIIIAKGCAGGGGGGGAAAGTTSLGANGGGGGGASVWGEHAESVTPATAITVNVGAGGAGGSSGSGPGGPGGNDSLVIGGSTVIVQWIGGSGGTSLDATTSTTDFTSQNFLAAGGPPSTVGGVSANGSYYSSTPPSAPGQGGAGGGSGLFSSLSAVIAIAYAGNDAAIGPTAIAGQGGAAGSAGASGSGSPGKGGGGGGGGPRGNGGAGGPGGSGSSATVGGIGNAGTGASANTCAGGGGAGGGGAGSITPGAAAAGGPGGSGFVEISELFRFLEAGVDNENAILKPWMRSYRMAANDY